MKTALERAELKDHVERVRSALNVAVLQTQTVSPYAPYAVMHLLVDMLSEDSIESKIRGEMRSPLPRGVVMGGFLIGVELPNNLCVNDVLISEGWDTLRQQHIDRQRQELDEEFASCVDWVWSDMTVGSAHVFLASQLSLFGMDCLIRVKELARAAVCAHEINRKTLPVSQVRPSARL